MRYGYARVDTTARTLSIRIGALRATGCVVARQEAESASSRGGRTDLAALLDFIGEGDELAVTRIDPLGLLMGEPFGQGSRRLPVDVAQDDGSILHPLHR